MWVKKLKIEELQTTINKLDGQLAELEQQMQGLISERNIGANRRP
jgi:prefoldin subunit 5